MHHLVYPHIDPVAFSLGPLHVRWYGLMYLVGIGFAMLLANARAKRSNGFWTSEQISDLVFYSFLGVILGGRIGYVLIYQWDYFIANPLYLFKIWTGGMSFHGGLIGVILAMWLFGRKNSRHFMTVADFVAPLVPFGLGAGRIGNFINGELWGRVTDMPWGVIYPQAGPLPRHPSEIYEFTMEGVLLFIILNLYWKRNPPRGSVAGMFLVCYGLFRFIAEFFRQPDPQMGFYFHYFTMGQILSAPMILIGLTFILIAHRKPGWFGNSSEEKA
nr:prolipoprotein diacylglyceryl transferase [Dongshaea marina]